MMQKSKEKNLDSRVFRHIVDAIASGELRAGGRIYEPELCDQIGVSRTPVRQALSRLVQEGILEKNEGRRGYAVPLLTPEDMDQVFTAREAVEGRIAELACRNATPDDIKWLVQANEEERERFEQLDRALYAALNEGFHFYLAGMCNNKYLQRFYGQLFWRSQLYIFHLGGFYTAINKEFAEMRREFSYIEHRRLIDTLEEGDPEKARDVAISHVRSTRDNRIIPELLTSVK